MSNKVREIFFSSELRPNFIIAVSQRGSDAVSTIPEIASCYIWYSHIITIIPVTFLSQLYTFYLSQSIAFRHSIPVRPLSISQIIVLFSSPIEYVSVLAANL
jgi:hypothetical protein